MTTSITFLLDRTGSMAPIKDATMEAFNGYLDGLRETPDTEFSLVQFDSQGIDKTCVNTPVRYAPRLTNENYVPRAATPLIDAAYKTIRAIETSIKQRPWITKVILCIQTDGFENASTQYTWEQLNYLIKEKTEAGWAFNFMGASIDAYAQSVKMGIGISNTVSYNSHDLAATRSVFTSRAQSHGWYASGLASSTSIGVNEKIAAGDKFAPELQGAQSNTVIPINVTAAKTFHSTIFDQTTKTAPTKRPSLVEDFSL